MGKVILCNRKIVTTQEWCPAPTWGMHMAKSHKMRYNGPKILIVTRPNTWRMVLRGDTGFSVR